MKNQTINDWTYSAEEHLRQQLLRDSSRPLEEKLRWLEDAHHMVLQLQEQDKAQSASKNTKENE